MKSGSTEGTAKETENGSIVATRQETGTRKQQQWSHVGRQFGVSPGASLRAEDLSAPSKRGYKHGTTACY